jgi:hypothetical protein
LIFKKRMRVLCREIKVAGGSSAHCLVFSV